ncbi:MAG: L,D-transpeptidase family protein [Sciscionella sp.]|nr:L,D-transpeptidase family protein [Sciscionella sp.]
MGYGVHGHSAGNTSGTRAHRLRTGVAGLFGIATTAVLVAGCTSHGGGSNASGAAGGGGSASGSNGPSVTVSVTPAAQQQVSPTTPIVVKAAGGTLDKVTVTNAAKGTSVKGTLSADKTSWTSAEPLGYGSKYNVVADAKDPSGKSTEQKSEVDTLAPAQQANPNMIPAPGSVASTGIGVGQPIVFQFSAPVKNKAAVQKLLTVKSNPPQPGAWYWIDDKNVHYRPEVYWKPGTTITVTAKVYGVDFGGGVWGAEDRTETYHVHDSWIGKADGKSEQMQIFHNGAMVKTMPVSMGKGSTPTHLGPHVISFKKQDYIMDSCTYGVCSGPDHYRSHEFWSNRISNDGEFVHENPNSVGAQGNSNVSHGCINLNQSNAEWFYSHFGIGDVVEVTNSGGKQLPLWDLYGDWEVPWSQWSKGNATS